MKFGSLKNTFTKVTSATPSKDGYLCVISKNLKTAVQVSVAIKWVPSLLTDWEKIAQACPVHLDTLSLMDAVENWSMIEPLLKKIDEMMKKDQLFDVTFTVDERDFLSCVPRTYLFADGSSYIHHIKLVRKARNAALPETLETVPLMYQAESGSFLPPRGHIEQLDFAHGTDFEAEVGVITDHVPMGTHADYALTRIRLLVLINDVSLRGLIPAELAQGFGFFQSKPTKGLSPFAITPDELGDKWSKGRVHLPLNVELNQQFFGAPDAGAMHFHFGQLISHAARTRDLVAGSLIGSGTVSNEDESVGSCCLVEKRTIEQIKTGTATTPFMKNGDSVKIWMSDSAGANIFGTIKHDVVTRA